MGVSWGKPHDFSIFPMIQVWVVEPPASQQPTDECIAGWWLSPTPLKNDGVRQLG